MAERRKCIALIGAGLSMSAGAPSWEKLMIGLVDFAIEKRKLPKSGRRAIIETLKSRGPETVADALQNVLGHGWFRDFVNRQFKGLKPQPVHSALIRRPYLFRAVFTTNFDTLIEKAYRKSYPDDDLPVATPEDINIARRADRGDEFYLMKLHGCMARGGLVFTRPEFISLEQNQSYMDFLTGQFGSNAFLFIGHSLSDGDTKYFLERLAGASPPGEETHFCLIRRGEIPPLVRNRLARLYGLQFLEYGDHSDILPFLQELARQVHLAKLSLPVRDLLPALGLVPGEIKVEDDIEILLCRKFEGRNASLCAFTTLPENATQEMMTRAVTAAAHYQPDQVIVVYVPWQSQGS